MKVLLVEDHALFREGVSLLLEQLADRVEVTGAETAQQALAMAAAGPLELVLLDYNLPDANGLECLTRIRSLQPQTPVIMLSAEQDAGLIQLALANGARGFITKASSSKVMISAVQLVLAGGLYVPPEMLNVATARPVAVTGLAAPGLAVVGSGAANIGVANPSAGNSEQLAQKLTERQLDVFRQMVKGLSNKEIARELNMSPSTVKVHVAAILRELDVKNRTQAVNAAKHLLD